MSSKASGHVLRMSNDTPLPELHEQVAYGFKLSLFFLLMLFMVMLSYVKSANNRLLLLVASARLLVSIVLQILMSWHALAMPRSYRTGFVIGHSSTPAAAPWLDRQQCQAHIALLACLHQLQEDDPAAAEVQQQLLGEEEQLMDTGLAKLGKR